ncbi:hypothetical protein Tco_0015893 [Tanacetum coccineum]
MGKGKQKTAELETISEADLTEAEQLKIITKRSRQETHSSHASGSGADEGTGVTPGVPDAPDYDSEDDISWKSSDDDQDDEQAQDDEDADKNDVNETKQDDEDDDEHDDNETDQNDDDEEQTESDDDGDDFVHPKLTTHDDDIIHEEETDEDDSFDPTIHTPSRISSSDDEDSDNEVEGTNVEGAKSDEDATYEEDQGNEAVEDTNTDLDGRDDVMTDVILPQVQATQEIEDTHVTLTPVNPDGQQQSSSVSSGFVSNMLNPNQDTGVDDIFGQHTEATSLIDTPVTAIMEPSFTAQTNRPPTPYKADKILLDTLWRTVTRKDVGDGADADQEPSLEQAVGQKRMVLSLISQSASQSDPVGGILCNLPMSLKDLHIRSLIQMSDEQRKKEIVLSSKACGRLLLGVLESFQRKLNLTKSEHYHIQFENKRRLIHHSSIPRGFIYENKRTGRNTMMRIDETTQLAMVLDDVRNALTVASRVIRNGSILP